jgi:hypothetical protein
MTVPPQQTIVLYFVVPVWLIAGFADWLCHRRSHIEATSGARESMLHLLLLVEMGVPLLAAIYLEVNALVLAVLLAGFVAHELTTHVDLRIATSSRRVGVVEQLVHSVLEMAPLLVLLLLASAHWGQWLAMFGLGSERGRFDLAWSSHVPPATYSAGLVIAVLALALVPYVEELLRARRNASVDRD